MNKVKPLNTSKEQIRSFLTASYTVLGYHNLFPRATVDVGIYDLTGEKYKGSAGIYIHSANTIGLEKTLCPEDMLTACLHESIHSVIDFGKGTDEKCTSTLTSKLKPDVAYIAQLLLNNTYQRAAYIAHTKLSYRSKSGDFYDDSQFRVIGVKPKYGNKGKKAK